MIEIQSKELRKNIKAKSDYGQVLHLPKDQASFRSKSSNPSLDEAGDENLPSSSVADEPIQEAEDVDIMETAATAAVKKPIQTKSPIFAAKTDSTAAAASSTSNQQLAVFSNQQYALTQRKTSLLMPKPEWHPPWKLYRVISGHLGWVRCIDIDPSNEWFVTGATDRIIKVQIRAF